MLLSQRQETLLRFLQEKHFSTVKELAALVWISESSVRRDLKVLEANGLIRQIYGGVVLTEYRNEVVPVRLRDAACSMVKDELAKRAADYLFDGAVVMMDGSSTVRRILKYLKSDLRITIITNNQKIFDECPNGNAVLYSTGGQYLSHSGVFVGSAAEAYIRSVSADLLFFSSQALSWSGEISDVSEAETSMRKAMLSRTETHIFLCDSSKLGQRKTFTLCTKDDVDVILCDQPLPWE